MLAGFTFATVVATRLELIVQTFTIKILPQVSHVCFDVKDGAALFSFVSEDS